MADLEAASSILNRTAPLPCPSFAAEDSATQTNPASLAVYPAEILALIADQADVWERNSLCRVNKFFSGACTTSLYGRHISIPNICAPLWLTRLVFETSLMSLPSPRVPRGGRRRTGPSTRQIRIYPWILIPIDRRVPYLLSKYSPCVLHALSLLDFPLPLSSSYRPSAHCTYSQSALTYVLVVVVTHCTCRRIHTYPSPEPLHTSLYGYTCCLLASGSSACLLAWILVLCN